MAEEIKKVITVETGGSYKSVKDLKTEISKLRDALVNLTPGTKEYDKAVEKLTSAQNKLNTVMNAGKTSTNSYSGSFKALRDEIKEARDVMAGATRGTEEYAAAASKAAEASDKLRDMQMEIANGASGLDNKFSLVSKTLSGISGGFAAAQGAMALFGVESENLQKTFVKLQAAISMTQGFKALAELPKALNAAKIAFGGVTTAAKGTTVALKGVKTAIAATGIGLLIVALGELIANWDKVTEAIGNTVGGLDHLREVMAGVANAIKNFVTGPMKALWQALNGNWKDAWNELKKGWDFSANYHQGVQKQIVKQTQEAERKKREEYDKSKDDYIKDMEAQYGADWKYTKEGQKAYKEYFQNKLSMYKKDSEEYKKVQREMWSYERELREQAEKGSGKSGGSTKTKTGKSEADKAADERMQAMLDELKAAEQARKSERQKIKEEFDARRVLQEEALAKGLQNQKTYFANIEQINKEEAKKIKEVEEKEIEELHKTALKVLNAAQTENEKELAEYRAYITKNMFPAKEELDLEVMVLSQELNQALVQYGHRNQFHIGDFIVWDEKDFTTVEEYLREVEERLVRLQSYLDNGSDGFEMNLLRVRTEGVVGALDALIAKRKELKKAIEEKLPDEEIQNLRFEVEALNNDYRNAIKNITKEEGKLGTEIFEHQTQTARGILWTFFDWRVESGKKVLDKEIEYNNLELASFIATSEKRIEQINQELITENLAEDEKVRLLQEAEEIKRSEIEKTAEIEQRNAEITLDTIRKIEEGKKQLVASTMEALGNTGDFLMNWSDNIVKKETKNGQKMSKEKEKQAKAMFEVGKALAISEAVVSTYQGAQGAFTSLASIPYVGPALGIAAAAAAITAGMLRVQSIASQKFGDTANISDGGSSIQTASAVAVPQLEGENPYGYTRNLTTAEEEDKLNQPVIVQVSDIDDALKVRESRVAETSF